MLQGGSAICIANKQKQGGGRVSGPPGHPPGSADLSETHSFGANLTLSLQCLHFSLHDPVLQFLTPCGFFLTLFIVERSGGLSKLSLFLAELAAGWGGF